MSSLLSDYFVGMKNETPCGDNGFNFFSGRCYRVFENKPDDFCPTGSAMINRPDDIDNFFVRCT
jgi:hypothetical protein